MEENSSSGKSIPVPSTTVAGQGKLDTRSVFISHSHADRKLAAALKQALQNAFSGILQAVPIVGSYAHGRNITGRRVVRPYPRRTTQV
jgi:hypothetical protein